MKEWYIPDWMERLGYLLAIAAVLDYIYAFHLNVQMADIIIYAIAFFCAIFILMFIIVLSARGVGFYAAFDWEMVLLASILLFLNLGAFIYLNAESKNGILLFLALDAIIILTA
jgi:hypothetical protein